MSINKHNNNNNEKDANALLTEQNENNDIVIVPNEHHEGTSTLQNSLPEQNVSDGAAHTSEDESEVTQTFRPQSNVHAKSNGTVNPDSEREEDATVPLAEPNENDTGSTDEDEDEDTQTYRAVVVTSSKSNGATIPDAEQEEDAAAPLTEPNENDTGSTDEGEDTQTQQPQLATSSKSSEATSLDAEQEEDATVPLVKPNENDTESTDEDEGEDAETQQPSLITSSESSGEAIPDTKREEDTLISISERNESDGIVSPDTKREEDALILVAERNESNGTAGTSTNHNHTEEDIRQLSFPTLPTIPIRSVREFATVLPQELAQRRARVNRILIWKRRHERNKDMAPRVVAFFAVVFVILSSLISGGAGTAYAYYQTQLPLLNGIAQHALFQTTHIYDRNGHLLYELYDPQQNHGRRTYVNYTDISPLLVNATIAAEDHTFWTNGGVDVYGIGRAAVSNLQRNGVVEGGSTVTQQLIKNMYFTGQDRTLQVKGEEAVLATGLTQQYAKWKIMEMYLNTVYYGDLDYGVEAAAEDYFQLQPQCTNSHCKPAVAQLSLAQASLLAGLPQSPSFYNPVMNKTAALDRQAEVLQSMFSLNLITREQMIQAEEETAKMHFQPYANTHTMQAPHFVRYLVDQVLIPLLGAQNVENGGYNVRTTLDLNLEKKVEQITYDHLYKTAQEQYAGYYGPLDITNNVNNAAVVVMNPKNGEILAMDGSAKYDENNPTMQGQYNAALSLRQPGSSFKPIVYATAFEMGWYPAMIVPDHKTIYPGNLQPPYYSPQNYDGTFHSGYPMTIRTAVANSFNIPAIDTIEYTGIPNVLNMAGRLGLTEVASKPVQNLGPSMAIGATEVSLLHMTAAYATFANQGVRAPTSSILEITDNQGQPIYKFDDAHPQGVQAVRPDVAFLINSILSDTKARYHEFGPGNPLELDRPAAAKTGTTDSFRDNWTLGYTPYLTVGVWAGNSDNSKMINVIGITGAGPVWHDVMEYASQRYNYPPDNFVKPDDVHSGTVSAITGLQPRSGEPTVTDWFIDGTLPTIQGDNSSSCDGDNCGNNNGHHHHNNN